MTIEQRAKKQREAIKRIAKRTHQARAKVAKDGAIGSG
jgi:hypothetical protein